MNQLGLADWTLDRHIAWDIGAAAVTRTLADALDAPAILSGYSRLIVDPNRAIDDSTLFIQVSDGIAIPANLELAEREKNLRIECFFQPYHAAIIERLEGFEQGA